MIENVKRIWESFKTGVMTLIFAYFLMYIIANNINALDEYNNQMLYLINGGNLFLQVLVAGLTYTVLENICIGFMNRVIKAVDQNSVKETVKNLFIAITFFVLVIICLNFVKVEKIIGEAILSVMECIIILRAIVYVIVQQINTYIYNKKLNEKLENE